MNWHGSNRRSKHVHSLCSSTNCTSTFQQASPVSGRCIPQCPVIVVQASAFSKPAVTPVTQHVACLYRCCGHNRTGGSASGGARVLPEPDGHVPQQARRLPATHQIREAHVETAIPASGPCVGRVVAWKIMDRLSARPEFARAEIRQAPERLSPDFRQPHCSMDFSNIISRFNMHYVVCHTEGCADLQAQSSWL